MKNKIPLIIAAVCGLVAVVLINSYLSQQRQEAMRQAQMQTRRAAQEDLVRVLVAKNDIVQGKIVEEKDLKQEAVPKEYLQPKAATSLERVVGKITIASIAKGEQILLSKLALPGETGSLANRTPAGKRAITVPVDNIAGISGLLKPGDYVDVLSKIPTPVTGPDGKQQMQLTTMPLFQNVLVLAVGSDVGGGAQTKEKGASTVTLALGPQEASLISFVQEQGKIQLLLRSPTDTQVQQIPPANWETLFAYLYPDMVKKAQMEALQPKQKPKEPPKVEIYRGLNKEEVILTK
ncbi:MAG: Flp pilus assembly protein CpaB [Candidatus Omnitrophota bacterium]